MHFNKKMDVTNALLRISDSLAFGAVARHVYGVIDDAENKRNSFGRKTMFRQRTRIRPLPFVLGLARSAKMRRLGK
jgi:hypothetical protein